MPQNTRRDFLKSMSAFAASAVTSAIFTQCQSNHFNNGEPLRNILFIISDDHSAEVVGCYGNSLIRTPHLDQLAAEGVSFTRAFSNAPVCSASRQSILTGKYPHASGVTLLRTSFPEEQYTIAEHLQANGFKTGVVGKTHFNNNLPHGFEVRIDTKEYREFLQANPPRIPPETIKTRPQWRPFRDPARIWLNAEMLPSNHYQADELGTFLVHQAIDFINQNQNDRFCLWVGLHEPHSPFNFPIEYAGKYNPADMPLPTGSPEDDRWIPQIFKDLTEVDKRGIIAAYYTSVEYLDHNIGLILNELKRLKLDENTLVIYVSDHSYLLGQHKRFEKHTLWDEALRVPLMIRAGQQFGSGRKIDNITELVDLAPTILEILGIEPMPEFQGKSLVPVLAEKTSLHKSQIFSEFLCDNKAMIRTPDWKYIFTSGKRDLGQGYATGYPPPGITHRLYDLKNDPRETTNLAGDPQFQTVLTQLQQQLLAWFQTTHPKRGQLPSGLSIEATLSWFCEPPDENPDLQAK